MINSSAIVIAGGKNKRINMVKPLINLGGKQILIRINDVLSKLFSETILVIRKDQSDDIADLGMVLGMHIVEDKYENLSDGLQHLLIVQKTTRKDMKYNQVFCVQ